jgi:aminoglycoside phosphotransferase (APT) family kinase protein
VGAFDLEGGVVSLRNTGEFYLLSEWAEGKLYAEELRHIVRSGLEPRDLERVDRLVEYLLGLHQDQVSRPHARERALRDLLGSGEGIFGIVDSFPRMTPGVTRGRLQRIEQHCHDFRWRLKDIARPLVRIHGDFHPFNLLFDDAGELRLLDTSRGSLGDAADDVSCLAINFAFFGLERPTAWRESFAPLWARFWDGYLSRGDAGVLEVVAPYFAWRALVLANPVWYPELSAESRSALLGFVELALEAERFSPALVECLFN